MAPLPWWCPKVILSKVLQYIQLFIPKFMQYYTERPRPKHCKQNLPSHVSCKLKGMFEGL